MGWPQNGADWVGSVEEDYVPSGPFTSRGLSNDTTLRYRRFVQFYEEWHMHAVDASSEMPGCYLYNQPSDLITNTAAQRFICDIEEDLRNGFGFVPFIGAGLSAPSGAPLVWDLQAYLERCIGLALGVEEPGMRPWNPRTDQWPPFIDRRRTNEGQWFEKVRIAFQDRRTANRWDIEVAVFQEGLGAMAEWRTALLFLSRLVRDNRMTEGRPHGLITLGSPDQEVIDACIREVLKNKQPTLGHRMLAALGGLLRLDVILSTNFDDLLERAFIGARNPLTVFDVHLNSTLPHWSALLGQRSLIKLHGHRYSLRADYTLDSLPSEADRYRFVEYLISADGRQKMAEDREKNALIKDLPVQNHLLVMGVSAADRRTRFFIESAWIHLKDDFKVVWLCHKQADVEAVKSLTREFMQNHGVRGPWIGSRILRYQHLGLLFLQLYQSIRRGLPTTGMIFPSVSRLALPPLTRVHDIAPSSDKTAILSDDADAYSNETVVDTNLQSLKALRASFGRRIESYILSMRADGYQSCKLAVVTSSTNAHGVTSVCADVYDQLQAGGSICLWLDMNDVASADDLFEQLLEAAYYRLGIESWMPVFVARYPGPRADEIRRLAQSTNKPWVIFLNARETPGANFMTDEPPPASPNNWLDESSHRSRIDRLKLMSSSDQSRCKESAASLLAELCGRQSPTISVVLLCRPLENEHVSARGAETANGPEAPIIAHLRKMKMIDRVFCLTENCVSFDKHRAVESAIVWASERSEYASIRRRFLHALVLMQRTRFVASVWSDAVSPDFALNNSGEPSSMRLDWIDELEERGLIRRKAGGFIWIHAGIRNRLRALLGSAKARENYTTKKKDDVPQRDLKSWTTESDEAAIHERLAIWYQRILSATRSPSALFESLYHTCKAVSAMLMIEGATALANSRGLINGAVSLLHTHGWLIQTHGYSRGSCRRLEYISYELCEDIRKRCDDIQQAWTAPLPEDARRKKELQKNQRTSAIPMLTAIWELRVKCAEVMRAIAREVGEDTRADERHREVATLLTGGANGKFRWSAKDRLVKIDSAKLFSSLLGRSAKQKGSLIEEEAAMEWLRWWRWKGMLKIRFIRLFGGGLSSVINR